MHLDFRVKPENDRKDTFGTSPCHSGGGQDSNLRPPGYEGALGTPFPLQITTDCLIFPIFYTVFYYLQLKNFK